MNALQRYKLQIPVNIVFGIGKTSPNLLLNIRANSCANSKCCTWSSPTGTWVALKVRQNIKLSSFLNRKSYLCNKISAVCNTGYVNNPKGTSFNFEDFSLYCGKWANLKAKNKDVSKKKRKSFFFFSGESYTLPLLKDN